MIRIISNAEGFFRGLCATFPPNSVKIGGVSA